MSIWNENLLEKKWFWGVLVVIALVVIISAIINSNSVENQCRRRFNKAGNQIQTNNKLQDINLQTAIGMQVEECAKNLKK